MSVFHGKQGKGAMRKHRADKRWSAEARDMATVDSRRAWYRRALTRNAHVLESGSLEVRR